MEGLAAAASRYRSLSKGLDDLPRVTYRKVGTAGREQFLLFAARKWGADRKFSGSERSRKGKRKAGANYKAQADFTEVVFTATGDPWYITKRGRAGGKTIRPRTYGKRSKFAGSERHALNTPQGPRATSTVGRLHPQPNLAAPLVPKVQRAGTAATVKAWHTTISKSLNAS